MKKHLFMFGCAVSGLLLALAIHFLPGIMKAESDLPGNPHVAGNAAQSSQDDLSRAAAGSLNKTAAVHKVKTADAVPDSNAQQLQTTASSQTANTSATTVHRANSYAAGIRRAAPAVVSVYTSETIYRSTAPRNANENSIAPDERRQTNQGSGVIINRNGHILTSYHLIQNVDEIYAALSDGRLFKASLIGADSEIDLAVIHIESETELPWCELDNPATLEVGDIVLAIGNPYGVGQTATQGIVSALRRRIAGVSLLQNFIQIDAAINPGNSGGALINPAGDLVGINTAVFSRQNGAQGIGFAIPAELIRQAVPQIIKYGRVIRGWLGVGVEDLNNHPGLYKVASSGAVVAGLFENSPASAAGLRRGDIITRINGEPVVSAGQILTTIARLQPGEVVALDVHRNAESLQLQATLTERPVFESQNR